MLRLSTTANYLLTVAGLDRDGRLSKDCHVLSSQKMPVDRRVSAVNCSLSIGVCLLSTDCLDLLHRSLIKKPYKGEVPALYKNPKGEAAERDSSLTLFVVGLSLPWMQERARVS